MSCLSSKVKVENYRKKKVAKVVGVVLSERSLFTQIFSSLLLITVPFLLLSRRFVVHFVSFYSVFGMILTYTVR